MGWENMMWYQGILSGGKMVYGLTEEQANALERQDKAEQLKRDSQASIDKSKQQIQSKNTSAQVADTLSGLTVNTPQPDGTTTQEPAKPSNLEQLNRMSMQRAGTAPMSVLRPDSQDPNIRQTAQNLGETSRVAQMSNQDIYSENQLIDKYSQVPEVQSYLANQNKNALNKGISDIGSGLSSGRYGQQGTESFDVTKLSGDFTKALSEAGISDEAVNSIQDIIKNEAKKTSKANTPFNMVGARIKYDTPEYRDLIKQQIDDSLNGGKISQEQSDFAKDQVDNGFAYDYGLAFMKNGVDASLKRGVKVADEYALNVPQAAGAAANTEATENKKREIQANNPILSEAQGGALSDAYNAVNYLNTLKSKLKSNDLNYFDIDRKTGQFVNPDAGDAYLQLVEIVGRKRSGAAISDSEWKNFGKQVLNKNNLLTDAGKKTAIEGLDRYLDKFYGAGVTTTGNEDWYNNYKVKSKAARQKAEGTTEPTKSNNTGNQQGNTVKIGDVVNGYRFKGGDPNNKNSWEKAK